MTRPRPPIISLFATIVILLTGIMVIIGWFTHNNFLREIFPGQVRMKFNVALCFVLASIVLLLNYSHDRNKIKTRISALLSIVVCLLGLFTLIEYIFGFNLDIDEFLVRDELPTTAIYYAGRMSPVAAINFLLIGTGLFLLNKEKTAIYQFFYLFGIAFVSLLMLIGFNFIVDIPTFIRLAIHVAIGFITLSTAIYFAQPMLQKKISFERKLFTGFTAVIILIAVLSIFSSYYSDKRINASHWVEHTNNVLSEAGQTLSLTKDIESGGRGYIITGDSNYLEYFTIAKDNIYEHIKNLKELTRDNPPQQLRIDSLSPLIHKRIDFSLQCIQARNEKGFEAANKLMKTRLGKFYTDKIRGIIAAIQKEENRLLIQREKENNNSVVSFNRAFFVFLGSVSILLIIILLSIRNNSTIRQKAERQSRENEEQIQTIFNAAPDAVIVIDEAGKIIKWNPKSETLFGWTATEVTGNLLSETIIPLRYRDAHKEGIKHFLATGEGPVLDKAIEIRAVNKNNIEFDVALSISPTMVNNHYLFIGFVRDITEHKKSEEKFRGLLEAAPDAMIIANEKGEIVLVNHQTEILFGYSRDELINQPVEMLIPGNVRVKHEGHRAEFYKEPRVRSMGVGLELFALRKDGTQFPVEISLSPLETSEGILVSAAVRDITDRKKVEEKIKESEHAFSTLFYKSPVMKAIAEASTGRYIEVNDAFADFFGFTKEDMAGKTSVELNIVSSSVERNEIFKKIQKDGFIRDIETQVIAKNGETRWVSTNMDNMYLYGKDCFLTAAADITKRKEAENLIKQKSEDLATAKQDIQDFIDSMSTLCAKVTTDGRFLMINKPALQASGLSMEELLRTNFLEGKWWTYDDHVHTRILDAFKKACSGITLTYDENVFVFDQILTLNLSLIPISGPDGLVDYIVVEAMDISDKKQLENQIREANINLEKKVEQRTSELERKNKDLEQFAYVASHDLQEPLRTTSSFVELFSKKYMGRLDTDADKMLTYMVQASTRMKVLIQDLLDYSRIGRKTDLQVVDCNTMVKDLLADLNKSIQEVNAIIHVGKFPVLKAYPTELKLLFQNLISNSIKFRRKDVIPMVTISAVRIKNAWQFTIEDNGIGIEEKYRDRIFVIFQRLHTRSEYEGSGIGLAHCKKIAELHGGNIWVESVKDQGSMFNFTIADM